MSFKDDEIFEEFLITTNSRVSRSFILEKDGYRTYGNYTKTTWKPTKEQKLVWARRMRLRKWLKKHNMFLSRKFIEYLITFPQYSNRKQSIYKFLFKYKHIFQYEYYNPVDLVNPIKFPGTSREPRKHKLY